MDNIKLRKNKSNFQRNLSAEIGEIKATKKILVKGYIYAMSLEVYKQKISDEITRFYN